ncbi:MAG TPA: GNAT family N-acetyltransferase [Flavobacteriales bacterium]|nr:GNAT family N-acetyltransferase [Flavobacteriales bacterium]
MKHSSLLLFGEESERLSYRKVDDSYFPEWLKFCSDEDSLRYIGIPEGYSPQEKCQIWFDRVYNRYENNLGGMNALVTNQNNLFIGQCGLLVQTVDEIQELEIGYSLMPNHRNQGYAIEAAKKCRDYAFENNLADSLISTIHVDNVSSAKVAVNNGMKLEKKTLFKGLPVNIYRISKSDWNRLSK